MVLEGVILMVSIRKTLEPTQAILDRAKWSFDGHFEARPCTISLQYWLQAEFPA